MNVLSLFDGMSCGQIALNRLGIEYDNYFASEIDKYAIKVTQANYPNTIQLGGITKWQEWDLPEIDLLIGGSPCQGFSQAGKGLNFDDPRSKLYFEFENILKHYNPKYWLLENVRMKQKHEDIISQRLGIKPIMINSALVSAQNRERLYWTNINNRFDLFGNPYCAIPQPEDKHIYLKDIIEDGVVDRQKSYSIKAGYSHGVTIDGYFNRRNRQIIFNQPVLVDTINSSQDGKVVDIRGKSYTLTSGHNNTPKISIDDIQGAAIRGRGKRENIKQQLEFNHSNKSNALTSVQKDSLISNGLTWRKLTPIECERLQIVPDNYTNHVSNSQRYKLLGNGWTVDVIAHILSYIL